MEKLVNIFLFGKKYEVPENLTIMTAMEYAGYQLVRGCGCRNGFCGACATIYRIKGDKDKNIRFRKSGYRSSICFRNIDRKQIRRRLVADESFS